MKKLLITGLLSIFIVNSGFSQDTTIMDKFVGTWRWVSGTDTVIIVLQRQNVFIQPGISRMSLVGWHKYVQNGQVVQSSLQYVGRDETVEHTDVTSDLKTTLMGHARNSTTIWFTTFWDLTLHKSCFLDFQLLPGSTTRATWKLSVDSDINLTTTPGTPTTQPISVLPKMLTLTKI